jgi:hypothetical protein
MGDVYDTNSPDIQDGGTNNYIGVANTIEEGNNNTTQEETNVIPSKEETDIIVSNPQDTYEPTDSEFSIASSHLPSGRPTEEVLGELASKSIDVQHSTKVDRMFKPFGLEGDFYLLEKDIKIQKQKSD